MNSPEYNRFQVEVDAWLKSGYSLTVMVDNDTKGMMAVLTNNTDQTKQVTVVEYENWNDSLQGRAVLECGGCGKDWYEADISYTPWPCCPTCGTALEVIR